MNSRGPYDLHISRDGIVRDRNSGGTRPTGPELGRVSKATGRSWRATAGSTDLGVHRDRYAAVRAIFDHYKRAA